METRFETTRFRSGIKDILRRLHFVNCEKKEILSELKEAFIDSDFRYLEQVTTITGDRKRDWLRRDILKRIMH